MSIFIIPSGLSINFTSLEAHPDHVPFVSPLRWRLFRTPCSLFIVALVTSYNNYFFFFPVLSFARLENPESNEKYPYYLEKALTHN